MVLIIDDTELTWSDTMDGVLGMDDESIIRGLLQRTREVLRSVTDFKGNISRLYWHRQPMDVMHWEVTFVGCGRGITVGDIEDVVRDILFNDEPRAA